uniref:Potassium channel domain-containing protein n=1 Tax=Meloidogyne incognita TaxID=6306 RepID=A0A914KTE6_MELIC
MVINNSINHSQTTENKKDEKKNPSCLFFYRKPLAVNLACLCFLLIYSVIGGCIFLYFEEPNWKMAKKEELIERLKCVERNLESEKIEVENGGGEEETHLAAKLIANRIVAGCVLSQVRDERMEWNLKNAALFGFGILTTLGYGKIEPRTTQGRLFTVFYGFLGVPFTVIIFTNFGRYLQKFEKYLRKQFWRRWRKLFNKRKTSQQIIRKELSSLNPKSPNLLENCTLQIDEQIEEIIEEEEEEEDEHTSPLTLIFIVILYLFLGAILIDWLDEQVDFPNGIYFAFLCLTAIEYGKLIPSEVIYLPIVIVYICFGLAISTIALDIGSTYVKKLYYLGRKIRNIASIKIWFGAKHLRVRELLVALGQNIGLEPAVLCDLDLEKLISNAIQVKEGRLNRVPQTHMIMDGIWPPELVPLFLRDGQFPEWVDADERNKRKWSAISLLQIQKRLRSSLRGGGGGGGGGGGSYRSSTGQRSQSEMSNRKSSAINRGSARSTLRTISSSHQPPDTTPPLPPERLSVRFEEFVHSYDDEEEKYSESSPINKYFSNQHFMRKSETVPSTNNPDISLARLCTFPSLAFRYREQQEINNKKQNSFKNRKKSNQK